MRSSAERVPGEALGRRASDHLTMRDSARANGAAERCSFTNSSVTSHSPVRPRSIAASSMRAGWAASPACEVYRLSERW